MWIAFEGKSFGGLVIPERLIHLDGNRGLVRGAVSGSFLLRIIPNDGEVFYDHDKCVEKCKRMNKDNWMEKYIHYPSTK